MLTKAEVEGRLKAAGAFYVMDADDLHEVWATPWGFEVWVPMAGPYRTLHEEDLQEIEEELKVSKLKKP